MAEWKLYWRNTYYERNKDIQRRRDAGEMFTTIAQRYSISVERVRQIYTRDKRRRTFETGS